MFQQVFPLNGQKWTIKSSSIVGSEYPELIFSAILQALFYIGIREFKINEVAGKILIV